MPKVPHKGFLNLLFSKGGAGQGRNFNNALRDAVGGRFLAEAFARVLETFSDYISEDMAQSGSTGMLTNSHFETFSRGTGYPPDGWEVISGDWQDITVIDGQSSGKALQWTPPSNDAEKFIMRYKSYVPVYAADDDFTVAQSKPVSVGAGFRHDCGSDRNMGVVYHQYDGDRDIISESLTGGSATATAAGAGQWEHYRRVSQLASLASGIRYVRPCIIINSNAGDEGQLFEVDYCTLALHPISAHVGQTSAQSINDVTWTKVTFNNAFHTYGAEFPLGTGATQSIFTAGYPMTIRVEARCQFNTSPTRMLAAIYKNGSEYVRLDDIQGVTGRGVGGAATIRVDQDDEITFYVYQDSGGAVNTVPNTGKSVWMTVNEVSP